MNSFFRNQNEYKINKIFCILEGRDELLFIKRLYELEFGGITCSNFLENKIELQWGKNTKWINKNKCNFQGGNLKECKTPNGVLEALNNSNYFLYEGLIIMFDKDCDINNYVENEIKNILNNFNYIYYLSNPCFEKEILLIVKNEDTLSYIEDNYYEIDHSKCKWYKQNFNRVPKNEKYKLYQNCESIVVNLDDVDVNNSFAKNIKSFIKRNLR